MTISLSARRWPTVVTGELEPLLGFFANVVVLRVNTAHTSLGDYLAEIKRVHLQAQTNQDVSLDQILQSLDVQRSTAFTPLFQIMLTSHADFGANAPSGSADLALSDVTVKPWGDKQNIIKYDLEVELSIGEKGVELVWQHDVSLFEAARIEQLNQHLCRLLEQFARCAATPDKTVALADLSLLSEQQYQALSHARTQPLRDFDPELCIHELFEARAATHGQRPALMMNEQQLSYAEFNARANRLACHLVERHQVKPDTLVAICLERSFDLLVAVMAVLKAGGAYVPLDPKYPKARLEYMLSDAAPEVVLTSQVFKDTLPGEHQMIALDTLSLSEYSPDNLDKHCLGLNARHLAYVIYTSGSTGKPKGVMVEHRGVVNFIEQAARTIALGDDSVMLQFASMCFDSAVLEWGAAFACGAALRLIEDKQDAAAVSRLMQNGQVSHAVLPPAFAEVLPDQALHAMKVLAVGGDVCRDSLLKRIKPEQTFFNFYGPTEASVAVCAEQYCGGDKLGIGQCWPNVYSYVLDQQLQPVPQGVEGELFIGGVALARGYLHQPQLTSERFIANPFYHQGMPEHYGRLYRTGDLVRVNAKGNLEFVGRADEQVQVRGYRIEPGEIKQLLLADNEVESCVLQVVAERLVAWVRPGQAIDGQADSAAFARRLKTWLADTLPEHMVPADIIVVAEWPLTVNGKLDKSRLPDPGEAALKMTYVAANSEVEQALCDIWAELLQIPVAQVSVNADFFALGGHSLMAVKLVAMVRERLGLDMTPRMLFDHVTVRALGQRLATLQTGQSRPAIVARSADGADEGAFPLSYAQQRLWFIDKLESGSARYNIPMAFNIRGALDADLVERAFAAIIERHQVLRSYFVAVDDKVYQKVKADVGFTLARYDFTDLPPGEQQQRLASLIGQMYSHRFDLAVAPPLWVAYVHLQGGEFALLVNIHHIAADGWSMQLLQQEFIALYEAFARGEPSPLVPLEVQYGDYAHWQQQWLQGQVLAGQLAYWQGQLADAPPLHGLTLDHERSDSAGSQGGKVAMALPSSCVEPLQQLCRQHGLTPFMLLHAILSLLLSRHGNSDDVVVGTAVANRMQAEIQPLIGFFANTLVLRTDTRPGSLNDFFAHVRQVHVDAQSNQDVPFEQVVEHLQVPRAGQYNPLFQIMFSGDGLIGPLAQDSGADAAENDSLAQWQLALMGTEAVAVKMDLEVSAHITADGVFTEWVYDKALFDKPRIEQMMNHYMHMVKHLAEQSASGALDEKTTLSDVAMLTTAEIKQLVALGTGPSREHDQNVCIHQWFEAQVARQPHGLALTDGQTTIDYHTLNCRANRLAHYLKDEHHIGPDVLVGICFDRCEQMIVAILAILKAGGAYLPLDPDYPEQRLSYMVDDAAPEVVLCHAHLMDCLPASANTVAIEQLSLELFPEHNPDNKEQGLNGAHLAYVIYTSGSTGQPKGVMIEHRNLVNYQLNVAERFAIGTDDTVLQFSSVSFDIFVEEMFGALCHGARLVLRNDDCLVDGQALGEFCSHHQVTVVSLPTSYWLKITAGQSRFTAEHLRLIILGGEKLPQTAVDSFHRHAHQDSDGVTLFNTYGPTEATVTASGRAILPGETVTIGSANINHCLLILDEAGQLCVPGKVGELYIGGNGVARGYLNREALSQERFIDNPYREHCAVDGVSRLYRTGDLVRFDNLGELVFVGRVDQQVKIHGFRIEISGLEHHIQSLPGVESALVMAQPDDTGQQQLVAYVGTLEPCVKQVDKIKRVNTFREQLTAMLPLYMVPGAFVLVQSWPLTVNGKVDKDRLPAIDRSILIGAGRAPQTPTQRKLVDVCAEVLNLPTEQVSIDASFFSLGGHSMVAVRFAGMLSRAFGVDELLRAVFNATNLEALAEHIDQRLAGQGTDIEHSHIEVMSSGQDPVNTLFLIPGVASSAKLFTPLAQWAQARFNVVALNHPGLLDGGQPFDNIQDNAEYFAELLLAFDERAEYCIGGHSFGGILAIEVARVLQYKGKSVRLMLIDAYWHQQCLIKGRDVSAVQAALGNFDPTPGMTTDRSLQGSVEQVFDIQNRLLENYSPRPLGPVETLMFMANNSPFDKQHFVDKARGDLGTDISVHQIDGDHFSLLQAGNVERMGQLMAAYLDDNF